MMPTVAEFDGIRVTMYYRDHSPPHFHVECGGIEAERAIATLEVLAGKGVFAPLADPAFFARVAVGRRGRSLEWPGELDFCADALWFEAHPQENPAVSHSSAAE